MKVTLISYSKRSNDGNCNKILDFVEALYLEGGHAVTSYKFNTLSIKGCGNCNYDCFSAKYTCPIKDDVQVVYESIVNSDLVVHVLPVYSAAPPSTYFAFRERIQFLMYDQNFESRYKQVVKKYIVIGSEEHGASETVRILCEGNDLIESKNMLQLDSHQFGMQSIAGTLIKSVECRSMLSSFVSDLCCVLTLPGTECKKA